VFPKRAPLYTTTEDIRRKLKHAKAINARRQKRSKVVEGKKHSKAGETKETDPGKPEHPKADLEKLG